MKNSESLPEMNSFAENKQSGRGRFAKAARGSGRKEAKVFRLSEPDFRSGEFKKNQRLHRYRNVRFAAPKHFYSTFFALEKSGTIDVHGFGCNARVIVNKTTKWFSLRALLTTSSVQANSFSISEQSGRSSIPESEAENNGASLCFVKSACVSGPDLSLLTKNTEEAILSERLRMELNAFFVSAAADCGYGQKVKHLSLEKSGIKLILGLIALLSSFQLFAQSPFTVVSKTSQEEITIKWLPTSYEAMRVFVREGCTVERVKLTTSTPQTADYSAAEKIAVIPAINRLKGLNPNDSAEQRVLTILDPFTAAQSPDTKESRDFAFAMAVLELTVSPRLTNALGCQFVVIPEENTRYGFRFVLKGYPPVYAEINTAAETVYPAITDFTAKIDRKKTVELTWTAKHYEPYGYAFQIEKSLDQPKSGTHLTETPYFPMRTQYEKADKQDFLRDEHLQEGKWHFYRLVGINYFGEEAYFSEWQKIYVSRHLNGEVYIDTVYADKETRVVAGTAYRLSSEPMNLKSFVLLRSDQRDGTYSVVQQKTTTDTSFRFTVDMLKTGDQFYYKVAAVSTDNDTVFSTASYLYTLDQEPPSKPTGLSGTINEKGIVSLSWTAPGDNDLQGYRIYRANHKQEDFTERNTDLSTVTTFTDTVLLNNLTPEVYYCVKAVDRNFNNSPFSDTILILKPDTIAPVAALLSKPVMQDSVIRLSWINSPSEDVKNNVLVRYTGTVCDTLLRWSDTLTVFTDQKITPGTAYKYVTFTKDKAGNMSEGTPRQLFYEPGYRKALSGFKAEVRPNEKLIRLSWQVPPGEVFSYQIYKATGEGKLTLLKTIEDPATTVFEDKQVSSGKMYKYTIKYTLKSGIHSLPATVVEVSF